MHDNFESLLRRCKAYHRKKMLKRTGLIFILLSLIGVFFWLYEFSGLINPLHVEEKIIIEVAKTIEKKPIIAPLEPIKEKVTIKTEIISKPIRKDVSYDIDVDESYLFEQVNKEPKKVVKKEPKKISKVPIKQILVPIKKQAQKTVKVKSLNKSLNISTKKLVGVKDLYKQYEKDPEYDLALKISQAYYVDKKFSKSSLWAKKANMLNKESDSAWIMYAKSEYARGNKDQAKEILQLYLGNKNSKDAEMLLMTWNQGE